MMNCFITKFFKRNYKSELLAASKALDMAGCILVDMRSDTVTKPTEEMIEAMESAPVGDDVYGEDPSVRELESKMAKLTSREEGLFVVSGTMGNLLAILSHCHGRGSEVLLGDQSHIFHREQANLAQFGGVQPFIIPTLHNGTFDLTHLLTCIRDSSDFHSPKTELLCVENTHGRLGGKVLPLQWLDQLDALAQELSLPLHLDGARVFNASVAAGVSIDRLLKPFTSASICLSKGLGAPVGTVLVGSSQFITRARRLRKAMGGGWRQAGVIAAAGLYALNHHVEGLAKDHEHARLLANGINEAGIAHACVNLEDVETNMVTLKLSPTMISAEDLCLRLLRVLPTEEQELVSRIVVKAFPSSNSTIRFVTHLDVSKELTLAAITKIQYVLKNLAV